MHLQAAGHVLDHRIDTHSCTAADGTLPHAARAGAPGAGTGAREGAFTMLMTV